MVLQGYNLPGVTKGPALSYIKWVTDPGTEDFPAFSLCMRWLVSVISSSSSSPGTTFQ